MMKSPKWFSWRQSLLYSIAALGGALLAQKYFLPGSQPTISIVIGAVTGANIGSYIQQRKGKNPGFDGLNSDIVDNSFIHGFLAYTVILAVQIFTRTKIFTSIDQIIIATTVMVMSLIYQALKFQDKLVKQSLE